jgi:hypothetical protein
MSLRASGSHKEVGLCAADQFVAVEEVAVPKLDDYPGDFNFIFIVFIDFV